MNVRLLDAKICREESHVMRPTLNIPKMRSVRIVDEVRGLGRIRH